MGIVLIAIVVLASVLKVVLRKMTNATIAKSLIRVAPLQLPVRQNAA